MLHPQRHQSARPALFHRFRKQSAHRLNNNKSWPSPNVNAVIVFPSDLITGMTFDASFQRARDLLAHFSINLWSIMKNCVGKDLSKIPIPVNFSEPISMLQRMTEELEYSTVLDIGAKSNDSWEQLAYVAAFTVSSYSTTATRVNKPFNPLLGETYECDRSDDLGWRSVAGKNGSREEYPIQ